MRTCKIILISILTMITAMMLLLFIIFYLIMGIGSGESKESIMLRHLSEKYNGQEFIVTNTLGTSFFRKINPRWECYPKGGDPVTDEVFVETLEDENGEIIFEDDYFGILIREEIETEVIETCAGIGLPMKAYSRGLGRLDNSFDGTKTYADLKQAIMEGKADCTFNISIFLLCEDIENREEYANQIFDKLSTDGLQRDIDVCVIADEKIYNQITRKNCYDVFEKDDQTMFRFDNYFIE